MAKTRTEQEDRVSRKTKRPPVSVVESGPEEAEVMRIGRLRCADFLELWARLQWPFPSEAPSAVGRMTILDLLASCYLQGIRDAAQGITQAGWKPPEGS
jgi:hypothetical protein